MSRFTEQRLPSLAGKVAVVTGGNAGLGYESCRMLASHGARVLMAARSLERANAAVDKLKRKLGPKLTGTLEVVQLDLADLSSIAAGAKRIAELAPDGIDILLNNVRAVDEEGVW
jgi:NAD(P)-dependent dehydrogenase (short-subunit alcohol dehydrogenase family)